MIDNTCINKNIIVEFTIYDVNELTNAIDSTIDVLKAKNIDDEIQKIIYLVIDEIVINFFSYGVSGCSIIPEINVCIICDSEKIVIKFKDNGEAFNPLGHHSDYNVDLPIEERSIGGLGIFIVKHFASKLLYERLDNRYNYFEFYKVFE